MKSLRYLVLIAMLFPHVMDAQFNPLTARDMAPAAVARARGEWSSDAFLQNILFAGGTQSGITLALDAATGKANAWVYALYSPIKDSVKYYIGIDVLIIGRQIISAPASVGIPVLPVGGHLELTDPFIDSPPALQAARDAGAAAFLQAHPSAIVDVAAAVNNPIDVPVLPKGKYWIFRFSDGADLYACWVSAETGSPAQCGTVTSASPIPLPSVLRLDAVAPHPVRLSSGQKITVAYELTATQQVLLTIHDLLGREINGLNLGLQTQGVHRVEMPISGMGRPGMYYLKLATPEATIVRKVLVID